MREERRGAPGGIQVNLARPESGAEALRDVYGAMETNRKPESRERRSERKGGRRLIVSRALKLRGKGELDPGKSK
jgi:hypothetical protein